MDRLQFQDENFDVCKWVNQTCQDCKKGENLERYLAELEMKVQLVAEDVEASLYESSAEVIRQVANASAQLTRLQGDLLGIGDNVSGLAGQVKVDERNCAEAVAGLRQLDLVKSRMEAACNTLKEASELSSLYENMEDVFNSGDLTLMAGSIATMHRSLGALGKVPQFAGVAEKLNLLEAQLREMVEPALAEAFSQRRGDLVQQHWGILVSIQKADLAQEIYVRQVSLRLQALWQQHASKARLVQEWLPAWHAGLLHLVTTESDWLLSVLSEQHPALLLQALSVTLKGFSRPMLEMLSGMQASPGAMLDALVACLQLTTRLCADLGAVFRDLPHQIVASLTHPLLQPFESFISDYSRLEKAALDAEVAAISLGNPATDDLEALMDALLRAPATLEGHVTHALKRCHNFTASLKLADTLPVLDETLAAAFQRINAHTQAIARRFGLAPTPVDAKTAPKTAAQPPQQQQHTPPAVDSDTMLQLLRIPRLIGELQHCHVAAATAVRERIAALRPLMEAGPAAEGGALLAAARAAVAEAMQDVVMWRLGSSRQDLARLAAVQERSRFMLLTAAVDACDGTAAAMEALLLQALVAPAVHALAEIDTLTATWEAEAPAAQGMPKFNSYASGYATAVGEYLIMLPQQLEVLVPEDADPDADTPAAQWLDRAVSAVAELLAAKVLSLPKLGSQGALQLDTDLEYVCNVVGALGVVLPPPLATASMLSSMTTEADFKACVASGLADGTLDRHACKVLAKMRGIDVNV